MASYRELLLDPRWQRRRLEIFQRDMFTCRNCLDKSSTLHVHHRIYRSGKMPWEAADDELMTLCEVCHDQATKLWGRIREAFATLHVNFSQLERLVGFAEGMVSLESTERGRTLKITGPHQAHGIAGAFGLDADQFIPLMREVPGGYEVSVDALHQTADLALRVAMATPDREDV